MAVRKRHLDAVIHSRVRRRERAMIDAAANITEQSASELIRTAALAEARRILSGGEP